MHFACFYGDPNMIRSLHKYGAQLNARSELHLTPMHLAAHGDKPFAITYLYKNGGEIDAQDIDMQTPLHWACYQGSERAIYYLNAWTKNVNAQDVHGKTPLHQAVEQAHNYHKMSALKELIFNGASRDIADKEGRTPYDMIAIEREPHLTISEPNEIDLQKILGKQPF